MGKGDSDTSIQPKRRKKAVEGKETPLAPYAGKGFQLRMDYKGTTITARVRSDGTIFFRGKIYNSPSVAAARARSKRTANGWRCWKYMDSNGDWVFIDHLRKRGRKGQPGRRKAISSGRRTATARGTKKKREPVLAPYVRERFEIRMFYKGRTIKARVRSDGTVNYNGEVFTSPSLAAAKARRKKTVNGWKCWKFKNAKSEWVYLDELR